MKRVAMVGMLLGATVAAGPVKSGRASVELLAARDGYEAGRALVVGVRMAIDHGWHAYWVNPGEGGMKPSVGWKLPAGWKAGALEFPVPKRFVTSGLAGFGYEGEVVLPVTIEVPAEARGEVELRAKVSWLTCDDSACVPGDAELALRMKAGGGEGRNAAVLAAALATVPRPLEGVTLAVVPAGGLLLLFLKLPDAEGVDGSKMAVFPATENVVDPKSVIKFDKADDGWRAAVPKSEYAGEKVAELELVLAGGGLQRPVAVRWTIGE